MSYRQKIITRQDLKEDSFTDEFHDGAGPELDHAVRLDLNAIVDLLELLSIVEICSVRALLILQHDSVPISAKLGVESRNVLVRNHHDVLLVSADCNRGERVEVYLDLGFEQ